MSNIRYYTDGEQATADTLNRPLKDLELISKIPSYEEIYKQAEEKHNETQVSGMIRKGSYHPYAKHGRGLMGTRSSWGYDIKDTHEFSIRDSVNSLFTSNSDNLPSVLRVRGYDIKLKQNFKQSEAKWLFPKNYEKDSFVTGWVEVYMEDIYEKSSDGYVFPYGAIQGQYKSSIDGVDLETPIWEGIEDYCSYYDGNKDDFNDYEYIGKAYNISLLSNEDKEKVLLNRDNMVFRKDNSIFQIRFRLRTFISDFVPMTLSAIFPQNQAMRIKYSDDKFYTVQGTRNKPLDESNLEYAICEPTLVSHNSAQSGYRCANLKNDLGCYLPYHDTIARDFIGMVHFWGAFKGNSYAYHNEYNPSGTGGLYYEGRNYSNEAFPLDINNLETLKLYSSPNRQDFTLTEKVRVQTVARRNWNPYPNSLGLTEFNGHRTLVNDKYSYILTYKAKDGSSYYRNQTYRGFKVYTFNKSDGTMIDSRQFDIYGDSSRADTMTDYLNNIENGSLIVISSYDHIGTGTINHVDLKNAMLNCGASEELYNGSTGGGYTLIGEKGIGDSNAYAEALALESHTVSGLEAYIGDNEVIVTRASGETIRVKYQGENSFIMRNTYGEPFCHTGALGGIVKTGFIQPEDLLDFRPFILQGGK